MELSAGTRLGPYEIVRAIGAGGMGVVYRAKDTRLDRQVAIKVLTEELRADADRLRRFEQEARTIGALNHPNLVTLHDVGRASDLPYLVTELLDGKPLRGKLADGKLAPRDAIRIASEIARGLAAAHGAGIVHRDIKPENIFVTADDRVKILDFGIAKLRKDDGTDLGSAATLGPTSATGTGVVIGTPGYMAPEQLAGGEVDARTDVFALGVVLYEMLAGKRPFAADTGIEESYAVVKHAPPELPETVPPALARIVMRCLDKKRELRFQSAADLAFALDALDGTVTAKTVPAIAALPPRRLPIVPIAALAVAGVLGAAWLLRGKSAPAAAPAAAPAPAEPWPAAGPVYHRVTFHSEQKWFARFAPDGKSVLYSKRSGAEYQVERASLARPAVAPIAGAIGRLLDVSPSGTLALRERAPDTPGGVLVTFVEGTGAPRELADNVHDATFVGEQLAIIRDGGAGMALEFPIGHPLVTLDRTEIDLLRASRDGSMFAFAVHPITSDSAGSLVVFDRGGHEIARGKPHTNIDGIAWAPKDREVWMSTEGGLVAMDLQGRERVLLRSSHDLFLRDVLPDGRVLVAPRDGRVRAYVQSGDKPDDDIAWRDTSFVIAVSRDGSTIGMLDGEGVDQTSEGYQLFFRRGTETPVAIEHGYEIALTPDGSRAVILCTCDRDPLRVVPTNAKGGAAKTIATAPVEHFDLSTRLEITADGKRVIAVGATHGKPPRLWSFPLDGGDATAIGPDQLDLSPDVIEAHLRFAASPDGKWIALPAQKGVRLVATTGGGTRDLTAPHGETPLEFSTDGKSLFVIRTKGWPRAVERVDLATGAHTAIKPIELVEHPERLDMVVDGSGSTIAYSWVATSADLYVLEAP